MLPKFGSKALMIGGAAVVAVQFIIVAFGPRWEIQAAAVFLMGWGFYSLHGSLQVFSSDLAPEARASALSLHAFFFFLGQAVGPIVYGYGLDHLGKITTLLLSAAAILALGIIAAQMLHRRPDEVDEMVDF